MSPQIGLIEGSPNKPCVGLPAKLNARSLVGVANFGIEDVEVLSPLQSRQCAENSAQAKGGELMSHMIDGIPIRSANGKDKNGRHSR